MRQGQVWQLQHLLSVLGEAVPVQFFPARQLQQRPSLRGQGFPIFFRLTLMSFSSLPPSLSCFSSFFSLLPPLGSRCSPQKAQNKVTTLMSLSLPWFMIPFVVQLWYLSPCVLSGVCLGGGQPICLVICQEAPWSGGSLPASVPYDSDTFIFLCG